MSWSTQVVDAVARGIAPPLRAAGFTKRGRSFVRQTSTVGLVAQVQASSENTDERARFTINLAARHESLQDLMDWPARSKSLSLQDCIIRERIGQLMEVRRDFWWLVEPQTDLKSVIGEAEEALRDFGLPFLEQMAIWKKARKHLLAAPDTFHAFFVHLLEGDSKRARACFSALKGANAKIVRDRARRAAAKTGLKLPIDD